MARGQHGLLGLIAIPTVEREHGELSGSVWDKRLAEETVKGKASTSQDAKMMLHVHVLNLYTDQQWISQDGIYKE